MPDHSYYAGKSDLLLWVNDLLNLNASSLDEFANGALYCQIVDAHCAHTVSMHKVNFRARKDYEIFANYKLLQAALNSAGFNRDLNIKGLLKAGQADILELLQWMFMVLKKRKRVEEYDAKARRKVTVNGGTNKVPLPVWRSHKYEVFRRPESVGSGKRLVNSVSETDSAPRHTRATRVASNNNGTSHHGPRPPRSPLPGRISSSIDHHPDPKYVPSPSPDNRPPWRSPGASPMRNTGSLMLSPKGVPLPRLKLDLMSGGADPSPSITTPNSCFNDSFMGKDDSVKDLTPSSPSKDSMRKGAPKGTSIREFEQRMGDIVPSCLTAGEQAVNNVFLTSEALEVLMQQVGTSHDTYACRAKLHSLRDAMNTLIRHTHLLLDDVGGPLTRLREMKAPKAEELYEENQMLIKRLEEGRTIFQGLIEGLAVKEQAHPVPKGTSVTGASEHARELGEANDLDGALRKVGAAKAVLGRALQKVGGVDLLTSRGTLGNPELDMEPSDLEVGVTERIERTPAVTLDGKPEDIDPCAQVGYPDGGSSEIYKGQYDKDDKRCGHGTYTFVNGDVYQGQFEDDEMHGFGLYTFSHEGHYEGQWVMGVYQGVGTETFALGSTYHGEYTDGARNGWGVCRYYNGDYYEGQWMQGLRDGRGMQQCTDDSNFVGDYHNGKRDGYGVYNFPNGDRYYGEYVNDIPHGHGVYRFSNGQKYEGQWQAGKKHGYCVYTVETNGVWERWAGEWEEGRPVWVESLSRWDNDVSGMPAELQEKMKQALNACRKAQESGEIGMSRADEHWQTDGFIQKSIREVVSKADKAAVSARHAQKSALEVAARLEAKDRKFSEVS